MWGNLIDLRNSIGFNIFNLKPFGLRFQLRPNTSGLPPRRASRSLSASDLQPAKLRHSARSGQSASTFAPAGCNHPQKTDKSQDVLYAHHLKCLQFSCNSSKMSRLSRSGAVYHAWKHHTLKSQSRIRRRHQTANYDDTVSSKSD